MTARPFAAEPRNANASPCESGATLVIRAGPGVPTAARPAADSPLVPRAFVAAAEQRYAFPVSRPPTNNEELVAVAERVTPEVTGRHVTRYPVIGAPLSAPGVSETLRPPVGPVVEPGTIAETRGRTGSPPRTDGGAADPPPRATAPVG